MSEDRNPRNVLRPRDGRGKGVGVPGGRRDGQNIEPCETGGPGSGSGAGRGGGRNRRDKR